jgi:hypothetical protein
MSKPDLKAIVDTDPAVEAQYGMEERTLAAKIGVLGDQYGMEERTLAAKIGPAVEASTTPNADPFDLAKLRLDQSFTETASAKKLLTTVPVRKPNKQDFNRVHPDPEYRAALALIELKDDREFYLLPPEIARDLPGEYIMVTVFTAINRQGVTFLWPVRLPDPNGRINPWHNSAKEAAEEGMKRWIRGIPNMSLGAYEIIPATGTIPDPEWQPVSFNELIRVAFRLQYVDSLNHPVIGRLRGL